MHVLLACCLHNAMAMCNMAPAKFSRKIVVDFRVKNVVDFCAENAWNFVKI